MVAHAKSRDEIIQNHTTMMSRSLLSADTDALIRIWDATYIFIEKSSNYHFQSASFSMHKKRNPVKFMILYASDGYMIDVIGP
jgi:hypothetical protein